MQKYEAVVRIPRGADDPSTEPSSEAQASYVRGLAAFINTMLINVGEGNFKLAPVAGAPVTPAPTQPAGEDGIPF